MQIVNRVSATVLKWFRRYSERLQLIDFGLADSPMQLFDIYIDICIGCLFATRIITNCVNWMIPVRYFCHRYISAFDGF